MSGDTNAQEGGLIRIVNPDEPVYRFFPLPFFEAAIRGKELVLVRPNRWEDPNELLPERSAIWDKSATPWRQIFVEQYLRPCLPDLRP